MPQGAISSTQYDILWQGLAEAERKHLPLLGSPGKVQRLKGIITDDFFFVSSSKLGTLVPVDKDLQ